MNKIKIWFVITLLTISPIALTEVINLTCFYELEKLDLNFLNFSQ